MGLPRAIENPAPTATRVQEATKPEINERIRERTKAGVAQAALDREGIECRLRELETRKPRSDTLAGTIQFNRECTRMNANELRPRQPVPPLK